MLQAVERANLTVADVLTRVKPRQIEGISALLLPYRPDGRPDFDAFAAHVERTVAAGLKPSVNMDTGYVNLLTAEERAQVLRVTDQVMRGQGTGKRRGRRRLPRGGRADGRDHRLRAG
jgi:hypothetical protein